MAQNKEFDHQAYDKSQEEKLPLLENPEDLLANAATSASEEASSNKDSKQLSQETKDPQSDMESGEVNDEDNMKKQNIRWLMLFMACFYIFGSNFCYDNPGPLETQLEQQFKMDSTHYSLLYTVYSIPNMLLPIFGGILLDSIGIRTGIILFCLVTALGQFVFMLGGYQGNYNEMIVGRIIFGMGGESMGVAQQSMVSSWFKGKELAFAFGLNLSISRLGSVINAAVVPAVYDSNGLGAALLVGFALACFSLALSFGMAFLDQKAEEKMKKSRGNRNVVKVQEEQFQWSDLASFGSQFWLLTFSCVLTYMSIFPYIQIASDLLQKKYGFDKIRAGYMFGVPYIMSAFCSPLLGLLIDRFGKRAFITCISSLILVSGFAMSMMMPECLRCYNEMYPLVFTGLGYSLYSSAMWGCIPYVVSPRTIGTAFGLTTAIQNIGLSAAPTIVGIIKDKTKSIGHGYFWVCAFFVTLNIITFLLNLSIYLIDIYQNNSVLDRVESKEENNNKQDSLLEVQSDQQNSQNTAAETKKN